MNKSVKIFISIIGVILILTGQTYCFAWNLENVFQGMSTNVTKPGSYQDQAAGYYSAGGLSARTSKSSFNPISVTAPSLTMSCSRIDAHFGSWSLISGNEIVQLGKNILSQAPLTAFSMGLKTYAPFIENTLKDIRNLAMSMNQFAKNDCEITKAIFASALPKDSAMRETVCKDVQTQSGFDYFAAGKRCRNDFEQKQAMQQVQARDPELMLDDYNIFVKAADKASIPLDMRSSMMSLTGTIIVRNKSVHFYDSL
ncbi:MAG: conjugal transfer protein TraH, partial [Rickettsia endosymbiont of Oxypoda opaca]|nr:conjugal transfer protein TraH [Rickettsia endosymbiont of Oxypoda opaca]